MDEDDWDEMDELDDGKGGGEEGGAEGGAQKPPEVEPEVEPEVAQEPGSFAAVVKAGARIKISMGMPAKWYGALVGNEVGGITALGFDDGDLQGMRMAELEDNFKAKTLLPAVPSEGGVVANTSGYSSRAVKFLMYENRGKTKTIGVFLGDEGVTKIGGLDVYSEVRVSPDAFEKKASTRGGPRACRTARGCTHLGRAMRSSTRRQSRVRCPCRPTSTASSKPTLPKMTTNSAGCSCSTTEPVSSSSAHGRRGGAFPSPAWRWRSTARRATT